MSSIRPSKSSSTWPAAVGLGFVLALAEGAASGASASLMSVRARVKLASGIRRWAEPAVTSGAKREG